MDKVGAVFGGSRGIGRAVAQLMAQKGYRLAIVARNLQVAKAAAGELGGRYKVPEEVPPPRPRSRAAAVRAFEPLHPRLLVIHDQVLRGAVAHPRQVSRTPEKQPSSHDQY